MNRFIPQLILEFEPLGSIPGIDPESGRYQGEVPKVQLLAARPTEVQKFVLDIVSSNPQVPGSHINSLLITAGVEERFQCQKIAFGEQIQEVGTVGSGIVCVRNGESGFMPVYNETVMSIDREGSEGLILQSLMEAREIGEEEIGIYLSELTERGFKYYDDDGTFYYYRDSGEVVEIIRNGKGFKTKSFVLREGISFEEIL